MFYKPISRLSRIVNRFGQGSILKMKVNTHHQINLITTWEDHSELDLQNQQNYEYDESNNKEFIINEKQSQSNENGVIDCLIPEYSGMDISMDKGTIE